MLNNQKIIIPEEILSEFTLTISSSYGLWFEDFSLPSLTEKLLARMNKLGIDDSLEYLELIRSSKKEITTLVELLITKVTSFFRVGKQFSIFTSHILPSIKEKNNKTHTIKIWSAGCSIGAEPYSLAMELLESLGKESTLWNIMIIASDISFKSLMFAKEGIYNEKLIKGIPPAYQKKYLTPIGNDYKMNDSLKRIITWDYHNLLYDNGERNIDIIFCRNVLYYFNPPSQEKVLSHFYKALKPASPLFLGHSEYLANYSNPFFTPKKINNTYFHEKKMETPL